MWVTKRAPQANNSKKEKGTKPKANRLTASGGPGRCCHCHYRVTRLQSCANRWHLCFCLPWRLQAGVHGAALSLSWFPSMDLCRCALWLRGFRPVLTKPCSADVVPRPSRLNHCFGIASDCIGCLLDLRLDTWAKPWRTQMPFLRMFLWHNSVCASICLGAVYVAFVQHWLFFN